MLRVQWAKLAVLSRRPAAAIAWVIACLSLVDASTALAADEAKPDTVDYNRERYEPAGFPLLGGDSDIGFEFGVVGTLSKFGKGSVPYEWNMDLVLALSIKNGPNGEELTQQSYQWNVDVPNLDHGRVRLNPQLLYYHRQSAVLRRRERE